MGFNENNCSWHFSKQPEATQDVGPNNAATEYFKVTLLPNFTESGGKLSCSSNGSSNTCTSSPSMERPRTLSTRKYG